MQPVRIKSLFCLTNVIRSEIAECKKILQLDYIINAGNTNLQIVFRFKDKIVEAALLNEEHTDRIVFSVLRGLSDPSMITTDTDVLEALISSFKERIGEEFPHLFEDFEMRYSRDDSSDGRTVFYVYFFRKNEQN